MLISVVVPACNRERYITRTLLSIKAQTHRPIELIVVDNNSVDSTLNLCKSFADTESSEDFAVKILQEKRPGACAARNRGLQEATSEWTSFFDSDDEMSPTFLQDIAKSIEENPKCDIVAAATNIVEETKGNTSGTSRTVCRRRVFPYSSDVNVQILTGELSTQSFVARTQFVRDIGGWDETLMRWNDWELGIRILLAKPHIAWIKGQSYHRIYAHVQSITGNSFAASLPFLDKALLKAKHDLTTHHASANLFSLQCRAQILEGLLERENVHHRFSELQPTDFPSNIIGKLLRFYTRWGGRGAWRIALIFTKLL